MTHLNLITSYHGLKAANIAIGIRNARVESVIKRKEHENLDSLGYLANDISMLGGLRDLGVKRRSRNRAGPHAQN